MLLEDYESRNTRLQEVMVLIEELVKQIPMAEKLLGIKGVGIRTVSGSCLIKSGFRAWKLVNPMAYFNSLNEVSIPHMPIF